MKFRFFYDRNPKLTARDKDIFSHGDYKCHHLFQNRRGRPVAISQHKDLGIWKVHHGFSTILFGTEAEAMNYCRERFCDLSGKPLHN